MKKVFVYGEREKLVNYAEALEFSGAAAVISKNPEDSQGCHGLLLPGGGDIDPVLYGAENTASTGIDWERDDAELELVERFRRNDRPILGICRGHQILNVAFGGDMIQDVENTAVHKWEEPAGDKVHKILAPKASFLYELYGQEFFVNSAHHQAVGKIAPVFSVSARGEDGIIEGMENREMEIYAVQWHPERMAFNKARNDTVDGKKVFAFFLNRL